MSSGGKTGAANRIHSMPRFLSRRALKRHWGSILRKWRPLLTRCRLAPPLGQKGNSARCGPEQKYLEALRAELQGVMYPRGKERPVRTCVLMTNATGLSDIYATLAKLEFQINNT